LAEGNSDSGTSLCSGSNRAGRRYHSPVPSPAAVPTRICASVNAREGSYVLVRG
jgi:hypothetical protein